MWYAEVEQSNIGYSAKDARAYSKLHFGVPILRAHDEEFRKVYDKVIKPLTYEQKLEIMVEPIDLPVTSRMKKKQFMDYLDEVYTFWTGQGATLTQPN
jgi:hypothetical protein